MKTRKQSLGANIFDVCNLIFLLAVAFICLYPMIYVVMASISSPSALMQHSGLLLRPLGFHTDAYTAVLENPDIITGYINTILYVLVGTVLGDVLTLMAAYVLSRRKFPLRNFFNIILILTMFISVGLIPSYLNVQGLGLLNTRMSQVLPVAISAYNVIIMRTYMASIPVSLEESARIDGASHIRVLFSIVFPLCLSVFAVITLYYAVGLWNSWFNAMIFLTDRDKYPLQLFLREILILNETNSMINSNANNGIEQVQISEAIKYATIVVSTVPILCIYPFLQKYFVQGVMVGAVKE